MEPVFFNGFAVKIVLDKSPAVELASMYCLPLDFSTHILCGYSALRDRTNVVLTPVSEMYKPSRAGKRFACFEYFYGNKPEYLAAGGTKTTFEYVSLKYELQLSTVAKFYKHEALELIERIPITEVHANFVAHNQRVPTCIQFALDGTGLSTSPVRSPVPLSPATREQIYAGKIHALDHYRTSPEADRSLRRSAEHTNRAFAQQGIELHMTTSIVFGMTKLNALPGGGQRSDSTVLVTPPPGRQPLLPESLEVHMKRFLVAIARRRCPMTLSTFVCQVNAFILDEGAALPKVDVSWARRFLDRNKMRLYTGRPLETHREKWDSSVNSDVWYTILAEVMVAAGIAEWNPHFDPSDPTSELVINIDTSRMFSADETKMDTDVQNEHSSKVIGEVTTDKSDTPVVLEVKAPGHYTGLACTGGDGSSAAMFAIFKGANVPRDLQGKEHLAPGSHHMDGTGLLSFDFTIVMLIYLF
jgi:hypothetical protein